jgi:transposase-like protein
MSEVARRLGIGRSTLYRKLKEFGLEPAEEAGEGATEAETAIEQALRRAG